MVGRRVVLGGRAKFCSKDRIWKCLLIAAFGWLWDTRVSEAVAGIPPTIGDRVCLLLFKAVLSNPDFLGYDSCGIHVWFKSAAYPLVVDGASVVASRPTVG